MQTILSRFGLTLSHIRHDLAIPGSPERCITRTVIETDDGSLWLLERLGGNQAASRATVAGLLDGLAHENAPFIHAPRKTAEGHHILEADKSFWQCSPFIIGEELPRPEYIDDAWRGRLIGRFIAGLQKAGTALPDIPEANTPALPAYVASLAETIRQREPGIHARIADILPHFTPLFTMLPHLPTAAAHGDCHPLNIIWGANEIRGVIDWEFAGRKPVLYDAANCIGCVGFEHPDWLVRGLVPALVTELRAEHILNEKTLPWLLPFTCALRFAWLSEWLRRDDQEMIQMELDYMHILLRHGQTIEQRWREACEANA
ncbi:phosphotransferase [Desulfovibrio mangrovi]|uniref:phosphotransferase enzyme family protein n=1 Tax=Desulfovibrio mangrovi TaxID=2976983 RepID=UPI0022474D6E|nr:phosphotransferase [Desulfovibrio mangrovi]UZP67951.1 phosphotransferase [Desulfovibrio mangrovi]